MIWGVGIWGVLEGGKRNIRIKLQPQKQQTNPCCYYSQYDGSVREQEPVHSSETRWRKLN